MSIKHALRMTAQRFGVEVNRYNAAQSAEARSFALLDNQRIDTILDVGANDGGYGKLLRRNGFRGSIISFEPLEKEHEALKAAADADGKWFVAPPMALGSKNTEVEDSRRRKLCQQLNPPDEPNARGRGTRVEVRRCAARSGQAPLDEFSHPALAGATRCLLKIDTQGYEMAVLQGAEGLLPRLCGVQLGLSLQPLYDGQALFLDLIHWLQERGFELWNVVPAFVDQGSGRLLQLDGVFFRSAD
jgi:FkbM family methyltransferase